MTINPENSELLLTAFRYVAGELSAEETTDFEKALAGDQSARDALADVVVLSEAAAVEEFDRIQPLQTSSVPESPRGILNWGTIAAVCILAVACVIVLNNDKTPNITEPTSVAEQPTDPMLRAEMGEAHSVLSLWSQLGGDDSGQYYSDPVDDAETLAPTANEVPDWMLSAISGADEPPADMPEGMRELMNDPDRENL